ncbi:MAG: inorganic phosphate transporter [Luteolibacter sp.]|uniref:inorganic phosphate transporter n=1 Tax=Luteolibacter sp. TaxID=1962973 RepID=UPI003266B7EB
MTLLLILTVCFLAWSNGANDIFKGVASLYGCGAANYRTALCWGILSTAAGSLSAIVLAAGLLGKFSGKGLVPDTLAGMPEFLVAVALAAGMTVLLATWLGFPISTTHALTGAMLGSGWMAVGSGVKLAVLGKGFLLPLLLSPVLAMVAGSLIYLCLHGSRLALRIPKEWCFCLGLERQTLPVPQPVSMFVAQESAPQVTAECGTLMECHERYQGKFIGLESQKAMDFAHFLSAGAVGFARGLNDTPKMAALLLVVPQIKVPWAMVIVLISMSIGGLLGARRVAETMAKKITRMNHGQGFSANLGTALLVTSASVWGLPVSTTHVSVGALTGIGMVNGKADLPVIRKVLLSWIITLPCAAVLGMAAYRILQIFSNP